MGFFSATHYIIRDFQDLLRAILGEDFQHNANEYIAWQNSLTNIVTNWRNNMGFDGNSLKEIVTLVHVPSVYFIKWSQTSAIYVFNEFLESTFKRGLQYCPNILVCLHNIYEDLKSAEKWVEKGGDSTSLTALLIMLDIFSTEAFSASKKDFQIFFGSLQQLYVWTVIQKCEEFFSVKESQYGVSFFISDEVRQKIENCVKSLMPPTIELLNQKFEEYKTTVEFFRDLIYKEENIERQEIAMKYLQLSDFLDFILSLFSRILEQDNCGDLFQLKSPNDSMIYSYV